MKTAGMIWCGGKRSPFGVLLIFVVFLQVVCYGVHAQSMDAIRERLQAASVSRVQEKVYVHTDNTCYFLGDKLWYKAYVVRADNLQPTDMSRLLYVELLSPDGLVVERQTVIVSDKGFGCGCFELTDTLFSGYYELRAYTRWMLNFNVSEKRYSRNDAHLFYNDDMAADFFRQWDGLYSRVFPVYAKPYEEGEYGYKSIYNRPRQYTPKPAKEELKASFYPEGGSLVEGVPCRMAFELTDQRGEAVQAKGFLPTKEGDRLSLETYYMGRGTVTFTPDEKSRKAVFQWRGREYTFSLPKAEKAGVSIRLENGHVSLSAKGIDTSVEYGLSVLCRGVLRHFQTFRFDASGRYTFSLPDSLPTGVNDVTVFDVNGLPLADRLFFVNRHDYDSSRLVMETTPEKKYEPYRPITLDFRIPEAGSSLFSLAVRDGSTDEPTYNSGNIMTDLLLSSELKGFVASPDYYFSLPDERSRATVEERAQALDLLMMVQGWRRYSWRELAAADAPALRYQPEQTLTLEGHAYKTVDVNPVEPDEIEQWQYGKAYSDNDTTGALVFDRIGDANSHSGVNHKPLRKEVMVEAEVAVGGKFFGSAQTTVDRGRFLFQLPPYYGSAILNMKAYKENDSIKKNMLSRKDRKMLDETEWPDFYVKRDLFFPVFPQPYSFYQNHAPDFDVPVVEDTLSELSMENGYHRLEEVKVDGRIQGRRRINFSKPMYVVDVYDIYNLVTDYGLSYGYFDMRQFPVQVARVLFGNMGRHVAFNVDAYIDSTIFYRSYIPESNHVRSFVSGRNIRSYHELFHLKRLQDIRVYTDYNPRDESAYMDQNRLRADVSLVFDVIPDDGVQPSFRDRHLYVDGITLPVEFYSPDYSSLQPSEPVDYRRTLYWNPNARTDEDGRFSVTLYNNSKPTAIRVSAAGVTSTGEMMFIDK